MFDLRAAHRRVSMRRGHRSVGARAASLMLILAFFTFVAAQPAPTLSLSSYSYTVGETLELTATNLEAEATYRVELTPPSANGDERAALVSVLTASSTGTLRYTSPLQYGGSYRVQVSGPRLDASLNVQVSGAESAVGQAPRTGQTPGDEAQPDQTQPNQTQPEQT